MRLSSLLFAFAAALPLATLAACATDSPKGDEEELLDDGKEDSQRKPTDHGVIAYNMPVTSELTQAERYHAWEFELSGGASVELSTSKVGSRKVDTVLYLYKQQADGSWGPYLERNDDANGTVYSQIIGDYTEGKYRVLVKGFNAATYGKFAVQVGCNGLGCEPADPNACVFGYTYGELFEKSALEVYGTAKIYAADLVNYSEADKAKLVRAVHQSSHTDVRTAEEAIARVDQGEVNVTWIGEPAAQRAFIAFEYGAGDNSYGAIFERTGDAMVSSIQDGDLYQCTVKRETCLLSDDWSQLRSDPAFTKTEQELVTSASQLSALEQQQAVGAFQHSYDDVTTAAEGLSRVDGNQLNLVRFTHVATGTKLEVFEYGAGDTSVGAIYYAGTTNLAGAINDLTIERCSFFQQ